MKKYVRASFNTGTIPDWLRKDKGALRALNQAGIDLANCTFSRERKGRVGDNYIAYLVRGSKDFDCPNPFVWIPGLYGDQDWVPFKNWDKKGWDANGHHYGAKDSAAVRYFAKKDLNFDDIIYINIGDNSKAKKDHYQDPRYDKDGKYAGQYWIPEKQPYSWEKDKEVEPAHWSEQGRTTNTGGRYGKNQKRDKSGYVIPNPKDRLRAFHETEEGRSRRGALAQRKIQQVYDDLVALRDSILGDLNSKTVETFGSNYRALDYFNDAVRYYKDALDNLKDKSWGPDPEGALTNIDYANSRIESAKNVISGKSHW